MLFCAGLGSLLASETDLRNKMNHDRRGIHRVISRGRQSRVFHNNAQLDTTSFSTMTWKLLKVDPAYDLMLITRNVVYMDTAIAAALENPPELCQHGPPNQRCVCGLPVL